jgi:hypothetical protein
MPVDNKHNGRQELVAKGKLPTARPNGSRLGLGSESYSWLRRSLCHDAEATFHTQAHRPSAFGSLTTPDHSACGKCRP